ncbi:GSU2403 family nucleotidyltransferase fold protein [Maricaulis sp.]|uniref:GSU2403 family nucleotidyltransferase fold protein n=1 Tax=Maricaulis sp. TaxID=1486257 RepID=UPI0026076241|nr:GSU2403 family nucleotidyltransferase fold protein [Maricaulis sp.]
MGRWVTGRAIAMTEDVDIATFERLAMVIQDEASPALPDALKLLGLEPVPGLKPAEGGARWRMKGGGASLDFLTPSVDEAESVRPLPALGVTAQSLHFLNYLIADPIPAVALYRNGVLVKVPQPARFAIHKLIVAQRRSGPNRNKARKDIAQAKALIEVLVDDRPGDLARAYDEAVERGPKWRSALDASVRRHADLAAWIGEISRSQHDRLHHEAGSGQFAGHDRHADPSCRT